ncbi:hypothetical protein SAMN04487980_100918 [Streptomyces sp. cf124]|uniref:hypothetical protein n=1 Tax=Streptomyces sp. cf124 TaxID=1761903 RepID=UPI0008EBB9D2|nr:hypothetical protein [Streptomyces sp. cf124]SFM99395.1 hypothetical protein SAMN04487980_100918 [Streptomyces sp. cf124]
MSIVHALLRWMLDLFAPGTGRRRAGSHRTACPTPPPEASRPAALEPPAPRSPYHLDPHTPLDGAASPLVRPYLVAVEREQARQSRRRLALVLAADFGIDLDRHVVGAEQVVAC